MSKQKHSIALRYFATVLLFIVCTISWWLAQEYRVAKADEPHGDPGEFADCGGNCACPPSSAAGIMAGASTGGAAMGPCYDLNAFCNCSPGSIFDAVGAGSGGPGCKCLVPNCSPPWTWPTTPPGTNTCLSPELGVLVACDPVDVGSGRPVCGTCLFPTTSCNILAGEEIVCVRNGSGVVSCGCPNVAATATAAGTATAGAGATATAIVAATATRNAIVALTSAAQNQVID